MKEKFHIGLHVKDIDRTTQFYTEFLGKGPVKVRADYAKYELEEPAVILTFNESPSGVHNSFGHLGIRVETEEELHTYKAKLEKSGFTVREEEATRCCYALQDKFWINDPDGYEWEVFRFLEDVEENDVQKVCCA